MSAPTSFLASAIVIGAASLVLHGAHAAQRAPATYTIIVDKMAFGPPPKALRIGDTIVWVNRDLFRHTATAANRSFDIDLLPGTSGRVTLTHAGTVAFSCKFHPGMRGALVVLPQ